MRDFSICALRRLFIELQEAQYRYLSLSDYLEKPNACRPIVILRHDIDRRYDRAKKIAVMEKEMGIRGTYYLRAMTGRFSDETIQAIVAQGHEIGYHYEDLHVAKGDLAVALESFEKNLERLREIAPVKTICMHGSPLSKHDNREMWKDRSYKEFGIIGEPYFDIDFSKVMYLTDTGRRWDGGSVSIRDRVIRKPKPEDGGNEATNRLRLHSTKDIITALKNNRLPDQIMLTIHPQRWTDEWGPWLWELISQKSKNVVKYFLVKRRTGKSQSKQIGENNY